MTTTRRTNLSLLAGLLLVAAGSGASGCSRTVGQVDVGLSGLALNDVSPGVIVPGTQIVVSGSSFVDSEWGESELHLVGFIAGRDVDVAWPLTFVDFSTMTVTVDTQKFAELGLAAGGQGDFTGTATVEVVSAEDGGTYETRHRSTDLKIRTTLTPSTTSIDTDGVIFDNGDINLAGSSFLLGGTEGTSFARIEGCFQLDTQSSCAPIDMVDIAMHPAEPFSRSEAIFPFAPTVAGIQPGEFRGTVTVVNRLADTSEIAADPVDVTYTLVEPQIFRANPTAASLGQYVFFEGGGFVGGMPGASTELQFIGSYTPTGGSAQDIDLNLIPEFVAGNLVRYVLNEDDSLGTALDLRTASGAFTGLVEPTTTFGGVSVHGAVTEISFEIAPIRQVVYLDFKPTYVEGLRAFGLRAVDGKIRERILAVLHNTYAGINMDFRLDPPTDFALFEHVEVHGADPNGMGLFGYDNSPGKDTGNLRLYDQLGGVNAITQADGYAGYGGVFVQSLMGFSLHPGRFAQAVPGADPDFDKLFDAFRPDQGGAPVSSVDLSGGVTALSNGSGCPASDRKGQVQCTIFVMGNLVGGTMAHEIGHSLGLAYPGTEGVFHDVGDEPNRLMDSGGARPFHERGELEGQGPGVFCDEEYTYLRMILSSSDPEPDVERPGCN